MKTENSNSTNNSFSLESEYLKLNKILINHTENLEKLQSELRKMQFKRKLLNQKS